ncbi:MAG: DUF2628 domain-containing protein [Methyloceanibacter sp.]
MTIFSVYEPQSKAPDMEVCAEALQFVKEGFSWPAFFVPALWLIYCRMWIELALFIVVVGALQWAFGMDRPGQDLLGWAVLALFALFAFEANDLRGAALERHGYRLIGVAEGRNRTNAELSFFETWLPQQGKQARMAERIERAVQRPRDSEKPASGSSGEGDDVIGLFPQA